MSRPRKKAQPAHEVHHADERWLVAYSDMVTVLFGLFIVLFAISSVDLDRYDKLKSSLGFGISKTDKIDVSGGDHRPAGPDWQDQRAAHRHAGRGGGGRWPLRDAGQSKRSSLRPA